ncbi:MAG: serine/threonine-protein kinase [Burkholderiaceae bacterium]
MTPDDPDTDERTVIPLRTLPPAPVGGPDSDATLIRPLGAAAAAVPGAAAAAAPLEAPRGSAHEGNMLPAGTFLGEFELTQGLGEGGFGIVYLARDHSLERSVALKEYMPSALAARAGGTQVLVKSERYRETFEAGLKSFINEAKLLAQFDHPSLVKVYRFWEANGTAYMVMPFYEGETLKQQLKEMGEPPSEAWLMELLDPLTAALEVIHDEQCFHRDIAPDNVMMLAGSNQPLLLDFGAARRVIGDMTQALTVILKPGYAPVEQYAEVPGMKQGAWTDVYALAAVVYYAITGKTPPTSVGRLMNDSYVPLAQSAAGRYSERFLTAIDRALVVKPEQRTPSIAALREALGMEPVPVGKAVPAGRRRGAAANRGTAAGGAAPASRTPLLIGGGLLAVAAIGGGAWALLKPGAPKPSVVASTPPSTTPVTNASPGPAPLAGVPGAAPAVAPALPPAVAPVANQPFDPVREFERIASGQVADFKVEAATTKPQFRIGRDRLSFTVKSAREGHLYVLLYGTDGVLMQLFPNALAKNNKVKAGQSLTLPQVNWQLDTAGPTGTDHFIALVSEHPRDFKAAGYKAEGGYGTLSRAAAEAAAREHRGLGSALIGKAMCEDPCVDEYGAALFSSEEIK